ncbi:MAG TPA: GDSL-type esterase/lipase family protein [Verrucomicrobiales bacterium]|nr:GDSL-type esterase/lipase family protein [Verrucomicrobiales bacterium]
MIFRLLTLFTAASLTAVAADPAPVAQTAPAATGPLALKDGDTVVLLGDAFLERDYNYGHLETALTAAAGKNLRIRNLGWSGDTPRCESRSYFGPPAEGMDRLRKQLNEIKPTIVIACYGAVDAFKGETGVKDFIASYERLLELIQKSCGASVILMSPPAVSADTKKWPSLEGQAAKLALYRDAIRTLAGAHELRFADLLGAMKDVKLTTVNGVSLTETDYRETAPALVKSLGLPLDSAAASAAQNNPGLTKAIIEKNRLFFYRWRPQNETYLFGFRKHEQGNNGVEIPKFDPLIAAQEQVIAGLLKK